MGMNKGVLRLCVAILVVVSGVESCALAPDFYDESCPQMFDIVNAEVLNAVAAEPRMAASLVRLHFHDCFVNGCDGSVLLDNGTYNGEFFETEKDALANVGSLRGFPVIDAIKAALEATCPQTVSCADILAITSQFASVSVGGEPYAVLFGRRDSFTASKAQADLSLPSPFFDYPTLVANFAAVGLNLSDLVALSGAHTFGRARCGVIQPHLLNDSNTINPEFRAELLKACPVGGNLTVLQNLDTLTPDTFDNNYYTDLLKEEGALRTDQILQSTPGLNVDLVNLYAYQPDLWFQAYIESTIKMGNISPLTGTEGEIRINCHKPNSDSLRLASGSPSVAYQ